MRGVFVTGTDTEVGKTVLAAAIAAALRADGESVAAFKPVVTGTEMPSEQGWPADHELLASVTGQTADAVTPTTFEPPVSPHYAAELAGTALDPATLVDQARAVADSAEAVVVEGVGGLMVPFTNDFSIRDFASELGLPVVIAARPGLGTINHTLLTVEAARSAGLSVVGVVLTPWPDNPSDALRSNRRTIEKLAAVRVSTLPQINSPTAEALAAAAADLPIGHWLASSKPTGGGVVKLRPYLAWEPTGNETDPRETARPFLMSSLLGIVEQEGPVTDSRLYSLYLRASGGRKLTQAARAPLSSAVHYLKLEGKVELSEPDAEGILTIRLPGTPTVDLRELGPRTLEEIPASELAELGRRLQAEDPTRSDEQLKRELLGRYGLTRLTEKTDALLSAALAA